MALAQEDRKVGAALRMHGKGTEWAGPEGAAGAGNNFSGSGLDSRPHAIRCGGGIGKGMRVDPLSCLDQECPGSTQCCIDGAEMGGGVGIPFQEWR
jgi:hypothetical protein